MKLPKRSKHQRFSKVDRAARYIETMPGAIEGEGGHNALFAVACRLVHGFGLSIDQAMDLLRAEYNPRCDPQWSDRELLHKCNQAAGVDTHQKPKEHLAGDDDIPPWEKNGSHNAEKAEPKPESPFVDGFQLLNESLVRIDAREPEIIYDCGEDLAGFELGPGKVTVVGAPPGTGKTSLASQVVFSAMLAHSGLKLVIANAEMDPGVLIRREIARRASVGYQKVRFATYDEDELEALYAAAGSLSPLMKLTQVMQPPYEIDRLMEGLSEEPGILVVDYLQKFRMPGSESLEGIELVMGCLRLIAMSGWAVLALSSTSRSDSKGGGKHDTAKLDMGSFRGSGEIEFQADAAYVLRDLSGGAEGDRSMMLDCVKNRHGARESMELTFLADQMRFETAIQKHDLGGGY